MTKHKNRAMILYAVEARVARKRLALVRQHFVNKRFCDGDLVRSATDLSYLLPSAAPNKTPHLSAGFPIGLPQGGQLQPFSRDTNLEGDRKC